MQWEGSNTDEPVCLIFSWWRESCWFDPGEEAPDFLSRFMVEKGQFTF